jgi:flavodoxin
MKSLVVYFSRRGENYAVGNVQEGNAEHIAKEIADLTKSDIFELVPVNEYSKSYITCTEEAMKELKSQARPEFKNPLKNIDDYETIYLCFPNWWGTFPRIVATFIEKYDFSNKVIKPVCTHEGSGMGSSESELKRLLPNSTIKSGLAIKGTNARNSSLIIKQWIENE